MRLIAVRHGETEWNLEGREMGQLDSPLTARGIAQSHALAGRLSRLPSFTLYSSDLGRARQTADIIAARCTMDVTWDEGLRERHMGIFQGLTAREMWEQFPVEQSDYERVGFDYVIPRGESARQRVERSVRVLTAVADRHEDETVVAVTHGGFLMGFFEHVLALPPGHGGRFKRYNASYNAFLYTNGQWTLEVWNDTNHLDGIGTLDDRTVQASE